MSRSPFKPGKYRIGTAEELIDLKTYNGEKTRASTSWGGGGDIRFPICPYGCGEEGQLVEIIQTKDGTTGLYKDSEGLIFTSPLAAKPKPNERKLVIGPDGEMTLAGGE